MCLDTNNGLREACGVAMVCFRSGGSTGARNVPALIPVRDRRCFSRSPLLHMSGPHHWCPSKLWNWIKGSRHVFGLYQTFILTRGTGLNNPTTMSVEAAPLELKCWGITNYQEKILQPSRQKLSVTNLTSMEDKENSQSLIFGFYKILLAIIIKNQTCF